MAELSITLNEKDVKLISEKVTESIETMLERPRARWYGDVALPVNQSEFKRFERVLKDLNTNQNTLSVEDIFFGMEMAARYAQWSDSPLTPHMNVEYDEEVVGIGVSSTMYAVLIQKFLDALAKIDDTKREENLTKQTERLRS